MYVFLYIYLYKNKMKNVTMISKKEMDYKKKRTSIVDLLHKLNPWTSTMNINALSTNCFFESNCE